MKANVVQAIASVIIVVLLGTSIGAAQVPAPSPSDQPAPQFTPEQLSQMLAPIALYPDTLLAQILMAATYPLEVVQADRWLQDSNNAALRGDQLAAALEQQPWDPSVKSLVPFSQILHMMDGNLDWTESLGDAFLANQAAVMDSVQYLRQRAQAAGKLRSTPQEVVTSDGPVITIYPPNPEIVYVPVYDPTIAYGLWPYPSFMPYYFPDFFDGVVVGGFGWFGVSIIGPLWGWDHWDWGRHRIDIDPGRFAALNHSHPSAGGNSWQHDPFHRRSVPYRDSVTRGQFSNSSGSPDTRRSFRGYPTAPAAQSHSTPGVEQPRMPQAVTPPSIQRAPPAFESYGRGADVRAQAERGYNSRMSAPSFPSGSFGQPSGGAARSFAPSSGGRGHR